MFSLKWFALNSKTNDLIIKMFDENKNIVWKKILTLYSKNAVENNNTFNNTFNNISNNTAKKLENYQVKPTDFIIYEPTTTWKITTSNWRITIRWKVLNKDVKKILVNDYSLKSYNGYTWRYHAFVEQETLKNWANSYTIQYLDKNSKVIYKEYYSIYKEKATKVIINKKREIKEVKVISSEAQIN
jgi:hypothetical protein